MHTAIRYIACIALICTTNIHVSHGQENAQTRIPTSLEECYQNQELFERDNRLPSTINILIELIRKVEDNPNFSQDMRQLSTSLLHRFKLDGIERAPGVQTSRKVIPFSPIGYQFSKHRLILSRLLPGNAMLFPNGTLSAVERCALHFMLSNSIETQVRGDEAFRCSQLSQLRANRVPRSVDAMLRSRRGASSPSQKNSFVGDVELLEELEAHNRRQQKNKKVGQLQVEGEEDYNDENAEVPPVEDGEDAILPGPMPRNSDAVEVSTTLLSQCPVQNGVIRTIWGSLSAGTLLSGIAAGLENQNITTRDLLALSRVRTEQYRSRQTQALSVDNRWAATLAGDLAEVALLQAPGDVTVGAAGGWNRTTVPRWYFLTQRERLQMTDAEMRGGLDGLILAKHMQYFRGRASTLKLSQVLDMYYSQRGVFSSNIKACDRRTMFTSVAPVEEIESQTTAFAMVLDREMQLKITLTSEGISQFASDAAQALSNYVPVSLEDLSCQTTALINDQTIRSASELYIFVDTTWQFTEVQPIIAYILDSLDVSRFGTTYTLLSANNIELMVNRTDSLADLYTLWNTTSHNGYQAGFSLSNIFERIRTMSRELLDRERTDRSVGGRSNIALILPQMGGISESDSNYAFERLRIVREEAPDVHIMFMAGGTVNRFDRFVRQANRDLFQLQPLSAGNDNVGDNVNSLIRRVQQVPRRIINHRCGSNWHSDEWGGNQMFQYVERGAINFYRVHPNYFFRSGDNRRIRIEGQRFGILSVCHSRTVENPRANSTNSQQQNDVECRNIDGESVEVNLQNPCEGSFEIQTCPPLFVSVEGLPLVGEETNFRCTDRDCRFPDSLRFLVHAENLGCFSGIGRLLAGTYLIAMAAVFWVLKM